MNTFMHCTANAQSVRTRGVTRALIGGGGGCIFIYSCSARRISFEMNLISKEIRRAYMSLYSYIRVLPDGFLLKLSSFQKKSVGQNTNI